MFVVLMVATMLMFTVSANAQEVQKLVNPGCTFTWSEPLVPNPSTPDPEDTIGAWELAGDIEGFQWVTNDTLMWDPLKLQLLPKDARTVPCSTVGVEALGNYAVMVKTYDKSSNASEFVSLAFEVVLVDNIPPAQVPIMEFCIQGTYLGKPIEFCGKLDAP